MEEGLNRYVLTGANRGALGANEGFVDAPPTGLYGFGASVYRGNPGVLGHSGAFAAHQREALRGGEGEGAHSPFLILAAIRSAILITS